MIYIDKEKEADIAQKIEQVKDLSLEELVPVKQYWEIEYKKHRKLDEWTMRKRWSAGNWVEAIERIFKDPRSHRIQQSQEKLEKKDFNPSNMSIEEAADYLNISKSKLYKMTSRKEIEHHQIGTRKIGFTKEALDKYLAETKRTTMRELDEKADEYLSNTQLKKGTRNLAVFRKKRN